MDIVNVVFRWLDFIVIGAIIFFIMKYVGIPRIEKIKREYKLVLYNLESDCKKIQLQTQSIYETMHDQESEYILLRDRFDIWKKKCDEKIILQKIDQQVIDENMQKSFNLRTDIIKYEYMIKKEIPAVLDQTKELLYATYSQVDHQKSYIDQLIFYMKELS